MTDKQLLLNAFETLLKEITPENLLSKQCSFNENILKIQNSTFDLSKFKNIYLLGSGKAVLPMAKSLQNMLGDRIKDTLLVGAYKKNIDLKDTTYIQSSHPIPSQKSIDAAKKLTTKMQNMNRDDFYIYLLSGGTSSLLELPAADITLEDMQIITKMMLENAMDIEKINCVRKHISDLKGGKLAQNTKAKGIVLVLSDILGDNLQNIGSAPLYSDKTTFRDAINYLKSFKILDKIPTNIKQYLIDGFDKEYKENLKKEENNIEHFIIGSNDIVLKTAETLLEKSFPTTIIKNPINKEAEIEAKKLINFAKNYNGKKHCFLFGAEATVKVTKKGVGGRNQHLALNFLKYYDKSFKMTFLAAATDGIDGNSDAAGACINSLSKTKTDTDMMIDCLNNFNSGIYFSKTKEAIITGPTHNNLLDIIAMIL